MQQVEQGKCKGEKRVPWCARLDYIHCLRSILNERHPLTHGTCRLYVTLQEDRTVLLTGCVVQPFNMH